MELRVLFASHVLHVLLCTGFIVWDRRRLDGYGKSRMWHDSTLWLVGCGLFLPPIVGIYAHITSTRRGAFWRRHGLALLATVAAAVTLELCAQGLFAALGWSLPEGVG